MRIIEKYLKKQFKKLSDLYYESRVDTGFDGLLDKMVDFGILSKKVLKNESNWTTGKPENVGRHENWANKSVRDMFS